MLGRVARCELRSRVLPDADVVYEAEPRIDIIIEVLYNAFTFEARILSVDATDAVTV